MGSPNWLGDVKSTREVSIKQETRLSKEFKGRCTSNSGAKFVENDVKAVNFDIEAKTTMSSQYVLKMDEIKKMERRSDKDKIPLFIVEFQKFDREFVLMDKEDFLRLSGTKELIK